MHFKSTLDSLKPAEYSPMSSSLGSVMTSVPLPGCCEILSSYPCQSNGWPFFSQRYLEARKEDKEVSHCIAWHGMARNGVLRSIAPSPKKKFFSFCKFRFEEQPFYRSHLPRWSHMRNPVNLSANALSDRCKMWASKFLCSLP